MGASSTMVADSGSFGSAAAAVRAASAAMDYLNARLNGADLHGADLDGADLAGAACGELLVALGKVQAKLTAAHAALLRRFDTANGHDADGYGTSASWLVARAGLPRNAARAAVRRMRQLTERPLLGDALAAGAVTDSLAFTIAGWTRQLPAVMRTGTDRILLQAAADGASPGDLAVIAACAIDTWRQQQPDPDTPDDGFGDRFLQLGTTLDGAAVLRGDLTPECAAAVRAVLDALGKKTGQEDDRSEGKRFHDALQLAATLLLRARLVPQRAGADTQAIVHIPLTQLRQLPGAASLEHAWLRTQATRSGSGGDGYLAGEGAQAAACDAQTVPVVTATTDLDVIDRMIALAQAGPPPPGPPGAGPAPSGTAPPGTAPSGPVPPGLAGTGPRPAGRSPEARQAQRYAIARLAIDLVSGPAGIAATLRQGLLDKPWNAPSLPLDIGYSDTIPGHIRRAVQLRDRTCIWPKCDRPAAHCDIHHLRHKQDGGPTSVANCALVCQFHHDVCIHRRGWQLTLHPDGTTEARSPDGRQVLRSHAPPGCGAGSSSSDSPP